MGRFCSLEDFVVSDRHAWWSFDGFSWNEFRGIALEFVDALDEGGAVDGFGCVGGRRGSGELLEKVVDVGASDGAGLAGGCRVHGE